MNPQEIISQAKTKLSQVTQRFEEELKKLRTGRAHPSMLDSISVEAYGTPMPLIQLATITAPEPQLLQISPFDPNNLQAIATAIRADQSLGMNPADDGRVVRVQVPPLNEERRRELAKQVGQKQEEAMISLRAVRHEAIEAIEKSKKGKQIGEDETKRLITQIEEAINTAKADLQAAAKAKEQDILTL